VAFSSEVALGGQFIKVSGEHVGRRGGGLRGSVCGFSKASRKRALDFFNKLDRRGSVPTLFVTLTYPGSFSPYWQDWKADLRAFLERFKRRYPGVALFWRLEFQQRGAPHFHLLVFGLEQVSIEWLSQAWYEVVGSGDHRHLQAGTQVQRVKSWRMACYYLAKYVAKVEAVSEPTGRIWGVVNRSALLVRVVEVVLSPAQFYRLRRVLRSWLERVRGRRLWYGRGRGDGLTCYIPSDDALRLLSWSAV
jgi:hypothetical protein